MERAVVDCRAHEGCDPRKALLALLALRGAGAYFTVLHVAHHALASKVALEVVFDAFHAGLVVVPVVVAFLAVGVDFLAVVALFELLGVVVARRAVNNLSGHRIARSDIGAAVRAERVALCDVRERRDAPAADIRLRAGAAVALVAGRALLVLQREPSATCLALGKRNIGARLCLGARVVLAVQGAHQHAGPVAQDVLRLLKLARCGEALQAPAELIDHEAGP